MSQPTLLELFVSFGFSDTSSSSSHTASGAGKEDFFDDTSQMTNSLRNKLTGGAYKNGHIPQETQASSEPTPNVLLFFTDLLLSV